MNAQEARNKADEINTNAENSQYADVKKRIDKEVDKYKCYWYSPLLSAVQEKLEKEGYKISTYSDMRNETTVTITW